MEIDEWLIGAISLLGLVAVVGILRTKKAGFGRYSTSLLLLTMVIVLTALFFAAGKIDSTLFANIAFAIAGFAGGLITGKQNEV